MKVQVYAASSWDFTKNVIIEVNSIDEAIKRIQEDKNLVLSIIGEGSWFYDKSSISYSIPTRFIVNLNKTKKYDIEIEIYDNYIE